MSNIKILDCTLRDGGYINNWNFGYDNILKVATGLNEAKLDIIEIGFINENEKYDLSRTMFNNTKQINEILDKIPNIKSQIVAMIMIGKCGIENIQDRKDTKIDGIRVCFKKHQIDDAYEYCKLIQDKGYDLFLQPASVTDYKKEDILYLINKFKDLKVKAYYIVDTHGIMREKDVLKYYKLFNDNLAENIPIGFHSHNNLQLSFSNSQALINKKSKRTIYIDSSVQGMGRGAGNLCTELITQHLNYIKYGKYNILPILKLVDECINPIFKETPWGYNVAYYIASINECHPNYSTFLSNKQTIGVEDINYIMKQIPADKKRNYDEKLILELYTNYLSNKYDDTKDKQKLKEIIGNKSILLLAPGKSLKKEENKIVDFINNNDCYIISINFISKNIKSDALFISNLKRAKEIDFDEINMEVLYTSNIDIKNKKSLKFNYSRYLNDYDYISDNSALLLINILKEIGYENIFIAGFDGYDISNDKNYFDNSLMPSIDNEILLKFNKEISKYISDLDIKISFITKSNYNKKKN